MKVSLTPQIAIDKAVALIDGSDTGGSAALAHVLLHAYNAAQQPLDITELCRMDDDYEEIAWTILKHRVDGHEPHHLASDKKAFQRVVDDYWVHPTENQTSL